MPVSSSSSSTMTTSMTSKSSKRSAHNSTSSSSSSTTTKKMEVSITQLAALYLTITSILKVIAVPIMLIVGIPTLWILVGSFLDIATDQHTIASFVLWIGLTFVSRSYIYHIAPTHQQAQDAMSSRTVIIGIPILSILICRMLLRGRFRQTIILSSSSSTTTSSSLSSMIATVYRLTIGCILLSVSVILRYVGGRVSIVRCSSSPLFVNEWKFDLHNYLSSYTIHTINFILDRLEDVFFWRPKVGGRGGGGANGTRGGGGTAMTTTNGSIAPPVPRQRLKVSPTMIVGMTVLFASSVTLRMTTTSPSNNSVSLMSVVATIMTVAEILMVLQILREGKDQPTTKTPVTTATAVTGKTSKMTTPRMTPANARRLQMPSFKSLFAQMVICTICSLLVSFMTVLPFSNIDIYDPYSEGIKFAIHCTCVITSLVDLITSMFPITSQLHHELNPERYNASNFLYSSRQQQQQQQRPYFGANSIVWFRDFLRTGGAMMRLTLPTCLTIIIALLSQSTLSDFMFLLVSSYSITLYQATFDFILRIKLCTTPSDMRSLVTTVVGRDSLDDLINAAVTSILHSNEILVESVYYDHHTSSNGSSSSSSHLDNRSFEDHKQYEKDVNIMANTLRYKTPADDNAPHLEDDLFRVAMLRSLCHFARWAGIIGNAESPPVVVESLEVVKHVTSSSIPLLKSLCLYVGAMGETLALCATDNKDWKEEWLVPPGTIQCTEYALQAIASCFIWNMDKSKTHTIITSWSNNPIAFLVGSRILSSAFRLHTGIIMYATTRGKVNISPNEIESTKRDIVRNHSPELLSLYDAATDTTIKILEKIISTDRDPVGIRKKITTFSVDNDKWTQDVLQKIQMMGGPSSSPPPLLQVR